MTGFYCDKCRYLYSQKNGGKKSKRVEFKEETVTVCKKRLVIQFFTCPKCGEIYIVLVKDDRLENLIAERAAMERDLVSRKGNITAYEWNAQLGVLTEKLCGIIEYDKKLQSELAGVDLKSVLRKKLKETANDRETRNMKKEKNKNGR